MIPRVVAGHTFTGAIDGDRCIYCGRLWAEQEDLDESSLGKPDLAHIAHLTSAELDQIRAEKERRREARDKAWAAVVGVCST